MDESFRQKDEITEQDIEQSFHPCFNGCVFQTYIVHHRDALYFVSILVLMDESFRHNKKRNRYYMYRRVSILVLMDESFRLSVISFEFVITFSFHPCFNG